MVESPETTAYVPVDSIEPIDPPAYDASPKPADEQGYADPEILLVQEQTHHILSPPDGPPPPSKSRLLVPLPWLEHVPDLEHGRWSHCWPLHTRYPQPPCSRPRHYRH